MKWLLLALVAAGALASGCATSSPPAGDAPTAASEDPAVFSEPEPRSSTLRIGFWVIDLAALDREPRGTTFRLLDVRIFKLLEVGSGDDYYSFSLVEMPDLLNLVTTRREGLAEEHRVADLQALALAAGRYLVESERKSMLQVLKLPILGSLYERERDGAMERENYLYVFGNEIER